MNNIKHTYLVFGMVFSIATISLAGCGQKTQSSGFSVQEESVEVEQQIASTPTPIAVAAPIMRATQPKAAPVEKKPFKPFPVYSDENSPDNHYFPSGWMGDFNDVTMNSSYLENAHSGSTSIKITYGNKASQGARWAGVYWQSPANNWGSRAGGYDLNGATKLTFWARGANGGERLEEAKMGGMAGEYGDTDLAGIGPVLLSAEWKQFSIDLEFKDLSRIVGGFALAVNLDN
ncbi:MAG: hypothetical protein ACI9Y8_001515, partial [Candidatus Omnitrophota bacterium]